MVVVKWLTKVLEVVLVAIIALQAVVMGSSVVFRYILNSPIIWTDEIVRYSLIWMTFAGAALAAKDGTHIVVDVIDSVLPPRGQKITNVFADIVIVAFMLFLLIYGVKMTDYQRGSLGETLQWLNHSYIYVSIPIGAAATIMLTISKYFAREAQGSSPATDPKL